SHRERGAPVAPRRTSRASTHLPHQLPRLWPVLPPYRAASQGNVADSPCAQSLQEVGGFGLPASVSSSRNRKPASSFEKCRQLTKLATSGGIRGAARRGRKLS